MKNFYLDLDPANTDTDYFADGVIGLLNVPLTQLQTATPDGLAHQICIVDMETTDHSGNTFTVVGTDADGRPQTEAITGPASGATVESAKYFKTVTSVTPSVTIVATESVDIGFVDEFVSHSVPLEAESIPILEVVVTGTIGWDIETTVRDMNRATDQEAMGWANDAAYTAKTVTVVPTALSAVRKYFRFVANSYTNTAEVQIYGIQATPASNH
jgi:hypothetical protein